MNSLIKKFVYCFEVSHSWKMFKAAEVIFFFFLKSSLGRLFSFGAAQWQSCWFGKMGKVELL